MGDAVPQEDQDLRERVIYRCIVGSRAYGLDTEDSDVDIRGVYLAPAERQWSLDGVPDQLEFRETDEVYWELEKLLVLALKANPNILEVLHSPEVLLATPLAEELLGMRSCFVSMLVYQTFSGYAESQFRKMTRRHEQGRDLKWKHAMHLIRLLLSGLTALREGEVRIRVEDEHRDRLLAIRNGEVSFEEIDRWRLRLQGDLESAYRNTCLPDRPDHAAANAFLIRARRAALEGRT